MKIKRLFAAVTSAIVLVSGTAGMNICASDSEEEISGRQLLPLLQRLKKQRKDWKI